MFGIIDSFFISSRRHCVILTQQETIPAPHCHFDTNNGDQKQS